MVLVCNSHFLKYLRRLGSRDSNVLRLGHNLISLIIVVGTANCWHYALQKNGKYNIYLPYLCLKYLAKIIRALLVLLAFLLLLLRIRCSEHKI